MSGDRCVVHPSRPAVDSCPVCGRSRCRPDALAHAGSGCAACAVATAITRAAGPTELLVRAGLAGVAVAVLGGWVTTQYVGVHLMSLLAPALVGVGAAWAAVSAAGRPVGRARQGVLAEAAAAALIGTGLGFAFTPGGQSPLHPLDQVGPPYVAAVLGVLAWPIALAPPARSRRPDASDDHGVDGTV